MDTNTVNIESGRLRCLGTDIAYRRRRGGGRSLVLVHGISDDGTTWMPLVPALPPEWDVVMLDLRGHGRSGDPETGWTIRTMADEVAALIASLGLKNPQIAGHSMGAAVTLALASYYPDVPSAIFLEDPIPIWNANQELLAASGAGLAAWLSSVKRKTRAELESDVRGNDGWDAAEFDSWVDSKQRMSYRVIGMVTSEDFGPKDFRHDVTSVVCPSFLLTSDVTRGALVRDEDLAALESLLPGLKTKRLSGIGHCIRRESPDAYLAAFREFFA